jgi:hypothetical protein
MHKVLLAEVVVVVHVWSCVFLQGTRPLPGLHFRAHELRGYPWGTPLCGWYLMPHGL